MKIYMCRTCHDGFDIECSGGTACPECGSGVWTRINKLPRKAEPYRLKWAEKYQVMICDGEDDEESRRLDWEAQALKTRS